MTILRPAMAVMVVLTLMAFPPLVPAVIAQHRLGVDASTPPTLATPDADVSTDQPCFACITEQQRLNAGLTPEESHQVQLALQFERNNWANGSVYSEPFYSSLPGNASLAPPGTLFAVQVDANTSAYTVAPSTSLARILYQTADLNGTAVPASAYILFPYRPRLRYASNNSNSEVRWPLVAWGHGTSGAFPNCAPSHVRNLWYQFSGLYELALQGYVVVATDYAGLGVNQTTDGKPIYHQYCGNPAQANDIFHAVAAAQQAFPILSDEFVVIGHSQGGGAAWAAAQRQAITPVKGYLGAVAASPVTNITTHLNIVGDASGAVGSLLSRYFPTFFPGFQKSDFLTPAGLKRHELQIELEGCNSVASQLLPYKNTSNYIRGWPNSGWIRNFVDITANGHKETAGPLLVVHGSADIEIPEKLTTQVVEETCAMFPDASIEYTVYEGVTHSGMMFAAQSEYLAWIEDRFAGKPVAQENLCRTRRVSGARPGLDQTDMNYFLELARNPYQVA